jgi:hypothetical protein
VLAAASGEKVAIDLPYSDADLAALLDINWYIIPYANPDGFHWTQIRVFAIEYIDKKLLYRVLN